MTKNNGFKKGLQWWWRDFKIKTPIMVTIMRHNIKMGQWQVDGNDKYHKSPGLWWFKTNFSPMFITFQFNPDWLHGFMYSSEIQWNVKSKWLCQIVIIISI